MNIKQLKQGSQMFVPQTTAEAVLVKQNNTIIRLDQALELKQNIIITPDKSGLTITNSNLTHTNNIEPINLVNVTTDNNGHITKFLPNSSLKVNVNKTNYLNYNGDSEELLQFGDDFELDDNGIKLKWNDINNGTT